MADPAPDPAAEGFDPARPFRAWLNGAEVSDCLGSFADRPEAEAAVAARSPMRRAWIEDRASGAVFERPAGRAWRQIAAGYFTTDQWDQVREWQARQGRNMEAAA